jgi:hypothetical protein
VGSGTSGLERTSTFSPADAAPTPAPRPAASSPPTRTDTRESAAAGPGRRRGRALWVLAGLVAAVLAGLIVFWAVALDDDPADADTAAPTTAETTAGPDEPADGESSPTGESSPSTEESSPSTEESSTPSESESPGAEDPAQAVTEFFSLLPGDLTAAHELTSPDFQAEFPLERFSGFWDDFEAVQVGNVVAQDATTALVDITYVRPDGSSTTERHAIGFIEGEDGRLLLDEDTPV